MFLTWISGFQCFDLPGQAANGVDAASSTPTPSDRKEKKDKKDKSEKKDKKDKSHKKEKKSKKEKKDKDHERSDASPVRSPASVEMTAGTPSQLPGEPAATESKETVAVDPPEPESKQKNTLNAKSLAALNRANTCDLMQQGEIPAEVDDSSKSERLDLSDRTKSIRHAHLNKFGRSLKSSELISVIFHMKTSWNNKLCCFKCFNSSQPLHTIQGRNTPVEIRTLARNIRAGQLSGVAREFICAKTLQLTIGKSFWHWFSVWKAFGKFWKR